MAIRSFAHKELKKLFEGKKNRVNPMHKRVIEMLLDRLDASVVAEDMMMPGKQFHKLIGNRKGYYSVEVQSNWKLIFRFKEGDAFDVDYLDYH